MVHLRMVRSGGSAVHFKHNLSTVKVNLVPGPELSQLPSKSAMTKRTR